MRPTATPQASILKTKRLTDMTKIVKSLIILAIVAAIAVAVFFWSDSPKGNIEVGKAQIEEVRSMVQLCTVDLYNEVPVLDTINGKVIFAVQKQRGSVSFDLEQIKADDAGDTVYIVLPPEIIEINEATEDNSWEVIDTKSLSFFGSGKLTVEEENKVKSKIKDRSRRLLYENGTIEHARAEGRKNLQLLMEKIYRRPVSVTDPTPKGAHYVKF